ncbi:MAG TPA: hypothetical protein PLC53_02345, partial [Bacilli bacterium]|nr:hypothetical protein [Bacilli bacterium]
IKGFKIYIKNNEYIIDSYRRHKNYDMLTLKGINNINDIVELKGNNVYINREDIKEEFIDEDLKYYKANINNKNYQIIDVINNSNQKLLLLDNNKMIPYVKDFIKNIDYKNKTIYMNIPNGLL